MPKSDIVFGSEFSPAVIDLVELLEMVKAHEPNRRQLQSSIDTRFFKGKGKTDDPRKTLGDNTVLALTGYGIIERPDSETYKMTEFGIDLFASRHDQQRLKFLMGRHCLVNLQGMKVIECINDLIASNIELTKMNITKRLRQEGFHIPENAKHLNILRQWMEYSGILNPNLAKGGEDLWRPSDSRISELISIAPGDVDIWAELTDVQRDFARAFAVMGVEVASSSEVRDEATRLYGTEFPEGGLPQSVLHKLQDVGLIRWEKTTSGRGAKAHLVHITDKLQNEFLIPILDQIGGGLGPTYRRLFRIPFNQILEDMKSHDKHKKGVALEALAFYFLRRLDLQFVKWRLRSSATGGAEVDMIVEGARLLFSRWQIQCKNARAINLEDLAKEVGIATAIRSNVVMLIGTGNIGPSVHKFAKTVMQNTPLHIVLIDRSDLNILRNQPSRLSVILNEQAANAMKLKRNQLGE